MAKNQFTVNFSSDAERFESLILPVTESGCWIWMGTLRGGYGRFSLGRKQVSAHRHAYLMAGLDIPKGFELDHLCRIRSCVNPKHLEPVTHAENVRRGNSGKYILARTHCPYGHPYDESNTEIRKSGARRCRECFRMSDALRKHRAGVRVGIGTGGRERSVTQCPAGHPYNEENTSHYGGSRHCKTCMATRTKIRNHMLKLNRLRDIVPE